MQWAAVLISGVVGPAQQDTLPASDYKKVWDAILHMLNLSLEADRRHLRETKFGLNYHPCLTGQKI